MPDARRLTGSAFEIQPQPFDSDMLGRRVGRLALSGNVSAQELAGALPALVERWRFSGYWLVSCRVAERNGAVAPDIDAALRQADFRPVETLVTFAREIDPQPAPWPSGVDAGRSEDCEVCAAIGATALVTSRYNVDQRIDPQAAARLKAQWVRNAFAGRADTVLCARGEDGKALGFNLLLNRDDTAVIDLIAVAPQAQRRGFGRRLVMAGLARYAGRAASMRVGTQAVNTGSLALYRACGFTEQQRARTYHWIDEGA